MYDILLFLPALVGGGAERTLVNIANELDRDKYKVHFLIIDSPQYGKYKDEYHELLKNDIDVINMGISINKLNIPRVIRHICSIVKRVKPDIVMTTMLKPNILMAFSMMISGYRGKVILRESNNRSACNTNCLEHKAVKFFYGRYADCVIALTEGVKEDLECNFQVPREKITVVYNPVDILNIQIAAQENVDIGGENVIVAAGRLVQQKDYPTMLKAMSILKRDTQFHLYILGKGPLENEINQMIKEYGLENYVSLMGFQSNPYKYMSHGDVFLLSSAWEGFGHVIVEAMACGTAVVSTNCDFGPSEIITDGKNGLLVPVGDADLLAKAVGRLLNDKQLKETIVYNGMQRANDFKIQMIVKQYEDVFEKTLNEKNYV